MKKVLFLSLLTLAMAVPALAQNTPTDVGAEVACGAGTCKVPHFGFLGETVKYTSAATANGLTFEAADCCLAGDKYTMKVSRGGLKGSATMSHNLPGLGCTTTWSGGSAVRLGNSSAALASGKASLKITVGGGGFPAAAYARFSSGVWVQTAGTDDCGF